MNQAAQGFPGSQKGLSALPVPEDLAVPLVLHPHVVQPVPEVLVAQCHQQVHSVLEDLGHLVDQMDQADPVNRGVQVGQCYPYLPESQMLQMAQVIRMDQAIRWDQLVLEYLCRLRKEKIIIVQPVLKGNEM